MSTSSFTVTEPTGHTVFLNFSQQTVLTEWLIADLVTVSDGTRQPHEAVYYNSGQTTSFQRQHMLSVPVPLARDRGGNQNQKVAPFPVMSETCFLSLAILKLSPKKDCCHLQWKEKLWAMSLHCCINSVGTISAGEAVLQAQNSGRRPSLEITWGITSYPQVKMNRTVWQSNEVLAATATELLGILISATPVGQSRLGGERKQ